MTKKKKKKKAIFANSSKSVGGDTGRRSISSCRTLVLCCLPTKKNYHEQGLEKGSLSKTVGYPFLEKEAIVDPHCGATQRTREKTKRRQNRSHNNGVGIKIIEKAMQTPVGKENGGSSWLLHPYLHKWRKKVRNGSGGGWTRKGETGKEEEIGRKNKGKG